MIWCYSVNPCLDVLLVFYTKPEKPKGYWDRPLVQRQHTSVVLPPRVQPKATQTNMYQKHKQTNKKDRGKSWLVRTIPTTTAYTQTHTPIRDGALLFVNKTDVLCNMSMLMEVSCSSQWKYSGKLHFSRYVMGTFACYSVKSFPQCKILFPKLIQPPRATQDFNGARFTQVPVVSVTRCVYKFNINPVASFDSLLPKMTWVFFKKKLEMLAKVGKVPMLETCRSSQGILQ